MQLEGAQTSSAPTAPIEEDDGDYLPVSELRQQYLDYLTSKFAEIEEQKEARRYYHAAQISAEDQKVLEKRGQPIVVINAIARKINRIVGLTERNQNDPKAFARNPQGEEGADIATESVRYATEANDWKTREVLCVQQAAVEGIAGIEFKLVKGDKGDHDVGVNRIQGDDFFYDPASIEYDFSDAGYMGIAKWVSLTKAIELFREQEDLLRGLMETGTELTTYADREFRFINIAQKRVRLVEHWYRHKGKWRWCFYVSNTELDYGTSPFLDEKDETMPRFVMWRFAIDHDGDTYAFFRNLKSLQDEKNQRRSRALFISNSRRLIGTKNAVDDIEVARREWARPDGYIETNPGGTITPDNTQFDLQAQLQFLELTNKEFDDWANVDAATMTGGSIGNLSGYAINLLQQPGLAEIGLFLLQFRGWKLRAYKALWCAIQKYWTAERWIRVTGDEDLANWLQINGEADENGRPHVDEYGQPAMVNYLGALDVNFKFDEGPDLPNSMSDAYEVLKNDPNVPWQIKLELMPISSKRKKAILAKMQTAPDPTDVAAKQLTLAGMDASNKAALAVAKKEEAAARNQDASATEKYAKAFNDVVTGAAAAAKVGLDAAQAYRQDAPVVPVERGPLTLPQMQPSIPQAPMPPMQDAGAQMPGMPPPGPGGAQSYQLPF